LSAMARSMGSLLGREVVCRAGVERAPDPSVREWVSVSLTFAEAPGPEGTPERTPEGTPEPTPESTPEPTPEGTPEGTLEGTPEGTPEGTTEGIPEGTPEGTTEGTPEPTPQDTPEGTPAGTPPLLVAFSPSLLALISMPSAPETEACAAAPAPDSEAIKAEHRAPSARTMDLLLDVELPISVSFGRTQLPMRDVLKLTTGSIVELNRGVSDPVEVLVNHCLIARGEVVVVDGNYGVRIQQIVSHMDRLRSLR